MCTAVLKVVLSENVYLVFGLTLKPFSIWKSMLVSLCQLDTNWARGTSAEELSLSDWPLGLSLGHFLD